MSELQTRKWLLTINNYDKFDISYDSINAVLADIKGIVYYCMSKEVGEEGTPHIHLFIVFKSPRKFSFVKSRFPTAHLDVCRGSSAQNRDYVFKIGKYLNDKKNETNIKESHFEYGECPIESQGQRNDLVELVDNIRDGMSNLDLIAQNANNIMRLNQIDRYRLELKAEQYKSFRNLTVTYLYGGAGVGKTSLVYNRHGNDIYRVTDYQHPFDTYNGQDVLVFDEFVGQIPITSMLMYLDGYPLQLPARYYNRQACYTCVYILSNIPYDKLYYSITEEQHNALNRRVNGGVYCMQEGGRLVEQLFAK